MAEENKPIPAIRAYFNLFSDAIARKAIRKGDEIRGIKKSNTRLENETNTQDVSDEE